MNQQTREISCQIAQRPPLVALFGLVLLLFSLSLFFTTAAAKTPSDTGFTGQWEHLVVVTNPDNHRVQQSESDDSSGGSSDLPLWLLGACAILLRRNSHQPLPVDFDTTVLPEAPRFLQPPLRAPPRV